jgi:hypothetical protein
MPDQLAITDVLWTARSVELVQGGGQLHRLPLRRAASSVSRIERGSRYQRIRLTRMRQSNERTFTPRHPWPRPGVYGVSP